MTWPPDFRLTTRIVKPLRSDPKHHVMASAWSRTHAAETQFSMLSTSEKKVRNVRFFLDEIGRQLRDIDSGKDNILTRRKDWCDIIGVSMLKRCCTLEA